MSQTWEEKSTKQIIGDDEKHSFELAIIAGSLQRIAKAQEKMADYPQLLRENKELRDYLKELEEENFYLLADRLPVGSNIFTNWYRFLRFKK